MGKIYFIGDTHFGHSNVIQLNKRPFTDIDEMERTLIKNWNKVVLPDDIVYVLGDFCYRSAKSPVNILRQLQGKKNLIIGNHDSKSLKNEQFIKEFEEIKDFMDISVDGVRIILCHYPMAEWNGYYRGSWHIHGHIHNNRQGVFKFLQTEERALNAGADITGFRPVTFSELKELNILWKNNI